MVSSIFVKDRQYTPTKFRVFILLVYFSKNIKFVCKDLRHLKLTEEELQTKIHLKKPKTTKWKYCRLRLIKSEINGSTAVARRKARTRDSFTLLP